MELPVFPLNGAILLPGTNLPLNIFEKKYIQMIDYALANDRQIGMIQTKKNNSFFKIGCIGKITKFEETSDGRYQINLEGIDRFKFLEKIVTNYKFIMINAKIAKQKPYISIESSILNKKLLLNFKNFLDAKNIKFDTSKFKSLNTISLAKIICVISPLDYLIKQMLLEFDKEEDFCKSLISVLEIEMNNLENSKTN